MNSNAAWFEDGLVLGTVGTSILIFLVLWFVTWMERTHPESLHWLVGRPRQDQGISSREPEGYPTIVEYVEKKQRQGWKAGRR